MTRRWHGCAKPRSCKLVTRAPSKRALLSVQIPAGKNSAALVWWQGRGKVCASELRFVALLSCDSWCILLLVQVRVMHHKCTYNVKYLYAHAHTHTHHLYMHIYITLCTSAAQSCLSNSSAPTSSLRVPWATPWVPAKCYSPLCSIARVYTMRGSLSKARRREV